MAAESCRLSQAKQLIDQLPIAVTIANSCRNIRGSPGALASVMPNDSFTSQNPAWLCSSETLKE
jgi:hypothetical protein